MSTGVVGRGVRTVARTAAYGVGGAAAAGAIAAAQHAEAEALERAQQAAAEAERQRLEMQRMQLYQEACSLRDKQAFGPAAGESFRRAVLPPSQRFG